MLATLNFTLLIETVEFTQHELQKRFVVCIVHVTQYKVQITHGGHKVQSLDTNCLVST
jgi:hypothetical protein